MRRCEMTAAFGFFKCFCTGLRNQSALVCEWAVSTKHLALEEISRSPHPGGYAHWNPMRTRVHEAGDAVPGSQDSTTRGVRHPNSAAHPSSWSSTCDAQFPKTNTAVLTTTESVPAVRPVWYPQAYVGNSDSGLMTQMSQTHGGQTLTRERVALLRLRDRAA